SNAFYYYIFFFTDTPTTEIYTLSLHDALPISEFSHLAGRISPRAKTGYGRGAHGAAQTLFEELLELKAAGRRIEAAGHGVNSVRSEEHTSELQSRFDLVCRLLLEKKKNNYFDI